MDFNTPPKMICALFGCFTCQSLMLLHVRIFLAWDIALTFFHGVEQCCIEDLKTVWHPMCPQSKKETTNVEKHKIFGIAGVGSQFL